MTADDCDTSEGVSPPYLERLIAIGAAQGVEASTDIVARNGMKLLAKGTRIDNEVRERLLQHKLRQPLEDCVRVVAGVMPQQFGPIGERLLEQHPLLRALCDAAGGPTVPASMTRLSLSVPMQSLLTVYWENQDSRLDHAVGVAMLALALGRKLMPGEIDRHRTLAMAGLVHDVGEIYIDPQYLKRGRRLAPREWRHIVSHPAVGHRVLRNMVGAGPKIAEAVRDHHERLDGFGYPRRLRGAALSLDGQVLAASEWQFAMLERGRAAELPARAATRLILGEFNQAVLDALGAAAHAADAAAAAVALPASLEEALPRVLRIAATLRRFQEGQDWIAGYSKKASPALKATLDTGAERMAQIQKAFSMTGLDAGNPQQLLHELAEMHDQAVHVEVMAVLTELEWRMREMERAQLLHASMLPEPEFAVVLAIIERLKGPDASAAEASSPNTDTARG